MLSTLAFLLFSLIPYSSVIALEDSEKFAQEMLAKPVSEKDAYLPSVNSNKEHENFAKEMLSKTPPLADIEKDLEFVTGKLPPAGEGKGCKHCTAKVQNIRQPEIKNGIFVFVSFSMPKAALIELNTSAEKHGAVLILRGIYKDSFIATKDKILEINKDGLRLNIDPQLFKQYNIKRVPTFVRIESGQEIARLAGNVSLEFAVQKLQEVKP